MSSHEAFPIESKWSDVAGKFVSQIGAHCSKCNRWEWTPARTPGLGNRIFHNKGWRLGSKRSGDICPDCLAAKHHKVLGCVETNAPEPVNPVMQEKLEPVLDAMAEAIVEKEVEEAKAVQAVLDPPKPEPKKRRRKFTKTIQREGFSRQDNAARAARLWFERERGVSWAKRGVHFETNLERDGRHWNWSEIEAAVEPTVAQQEEDVVVTEDVRKPTIGDRRKIMDALEAGYDEQAERYKGGLSDQAVAENLKVPRRWVVDVREQFFGAHDRNEEQDVARKKRDEAMAMAQAAVDRLTQMAIEAEGILNNLRGAA